MALTMNDIYEILKNEGGRTPSEKVMEVSKDHPDKVALRYKEYGIWQETTYKDFWLKSNYVSMALRFFGVESGESVAIQSEIDQSGFLQTLVLNLLELSVLACIQLTLLQR